MRLFSVNNWFKGTAGMSCLFAFLLSMVLCAGACSPRVLPPAEHRDSVRVEYRERIDTLLVELEVEREVERVVVRDTASRLENTYAVSEARVDALGFLHHSLETKPQKIVKPAPVVVHDTLRFESHAKTEYIEVNRLTGAQAAWIRAGKVLTGVVALLVALLLLLAYVKMRGW